MKQSYSKNYLKIYFWQGISMVLNFLSMFIVIPYLTSDPTVYGIYSVCISFAIFLSYADLGFIGAGQKYASEYFAQGNQQQEIKVIGFTHFILLVFLIIFSLLFFWFSKNPEILVKGIDNRKHHEVASSLLLIMSLFTPTTLLQRLLQMIYSIRMEDYIIQRINIIGSAIKIFSVLWFFKSEKYDIVGYFLFTQIVNLVVSIFSLILTKKRYSYNFKLLLKSIHFNKEIFDITKSLAFTSLLITICWILYYELDSVAIGKMLGAKSVAIYTIGLTILSFFRSILGIVFSPFNIRFNHYIGINDEESLKNVYLQVVTIFAPIVTIPLITIFIFSKYIVLTWVGKEYLESISVIQFLILCNLFAFITYPTNFMLIAKEKQKMLYVINFIIPIIFWSGIFLSITYLGVKSFAIFKLIAFLFSAIFSIHIMIKYLKINNIDIFYHIFKSLAIPFIFIFIILFLSENYLPTYQSKTNLFLVGIFITSIISISLVTQFILDKNWRTYIINISTQLKNR